MFGNKVDIALHPQLSTQDANLSYDLLRQGVITIISRTFIVLMGYHRLSTISVGL